MVACVERVQRVAKKAMQALRGIEQSTPGLRSLLRHVRESLRVLIYSDVPYAVGVTSGRHTDADSDDGSARSRDTTHVKVRPYRDVVERTQRQLREVSEARDAAVARAESAEAAVNMLRTTVVACKQKEAALSDQVRVHRAWRCRFLLSATSCNTRPVPCSCE